MKSKASQLKMGAILSYVHMALNIIIGIAYTPIMLRLLGPNEYGLYTTVSSTISTVSILSLGLNAGYIRYYAIYKKNGESESIEKLNGLFFIVFTIIGAIAFLCGLFLTFNLRLVFDQGLTEAEYATAKILMLLLTINLSVSFPSGVFSHIISAHERFVFLKVLGIVKALASPLITLPLLLMGYRSIAMVVVTLAVSLAIDAIYCFYVFYVLKARFRFQDFPKGIFRSLFAYTGFIALNLIAEQINHNVDRIIIGRFLGTSATAVYAVGATLYTYFTTFSTAISGVFTPRIHKLVQETREDVQEQKRRLTDIFVRVGRLQFVLLALIASGLVFFGREFIMMWAGDEYESAYYVILLLAIPAIVPLTQNIGINIQRAMNNHQFRGVLYLIMSLINLVLTILLTRPFGIIGSTIGTAISFVVGNGILMNIFYHKKCNINIFSYWKNIFLLLRGLILPVAFGIGLSYFIDFDTPLMLLLGICLYSGVYCLSMWFIALNPYERGLILKPLKRVFKKHDQNQT